MGLLTNRKKPKSADLRDGPGTAKSIIPSKVDIPEVFTKQQCKPSRKTSKSTPMAEATSDGTPEPQPISEPISAPISEPDDPNQARRASRKIQAIKRGRSDRKKLTGEVRVLNERESVEIKQQAINKDRGGGVSIGKDLCSSLWSAIDSSIRKITGGEQFLKLQHIIRNWFQCQKSGDILDSKLMDMRRFKDCCFKCKSTKITPKVRAKVEELFQLMDTDGKRCHLHQIDSRWPT